MPRVFLSTPTVNGRELEFVQQAVASGWIGPFGDQTEAFEREIAATVGVSHGLLLSSGTAAIHLALKCAGVSSGDTVFCQSLTFAASCNPIIYEHATPVFIDSEPDSWNMSPRALERAFALYPKPKAVIVVHLYGSPANLDELCAICKAHQVQLIEDAAESLGATWRGRQTGSFGAYGVVSFNGNKIITTSGGGMLLTDNGQALEKAKFWSTQARDPARHYQHSELGYNYRSSNLLAAFGRGQLCTLSEHAAKKKHLYDTYTKGFADIQQLSMNPFWAQSSPNFWLSALQIDPLSPVKPLDIIEALEAEDIESRPVWKPMNLQPFYSDCAFVGAEQGGVCATLFERGLCLPSDIKMTDNDLDLVIGIVRRLFGR